MRKSSLVKENDLLEESRNSPKVVDSDIDPKIN